MIEAISKKDEAILAQEMTWKEIRDEVYRCSAKFAKIIDNLDPGGEYTVFKVRYPYGSSLLNEGNLWLPQADGRFIRLKGPGVPPGIQKKLGYNLPSPPLMLVLTNTFELCVPLEERVVPYCIMGPGDLLGFWQILDQYGRPFDPSGIWQMTAGARSIFMLPKISEEMRHDKLQRQFGFSTEKPRDFPNHWQIFRSLYQHAVFENKWEAEVLFFSKKWFDRLDDSAWREFKLYLLEVHWRNTSFWRGFYTWDMIFSRIQRLRKIRPSAYHADVVKHLFAIGTGKVLGFSAALDDRLAPIKRIQEIYETIYNLKTWYPIILAPAHFSDQTLAKPVYYSLQYQTAFALSTKTRERNSIIQDLYAVRSLLDKYLQELSKDSAYLQSTPLYDLVDKVNFDFYHSDPGDYAKIKANSLIPLEDMDFANAVRNSAKKFPINSLFFNGCIKISRK